MAATEGIPGSETSGRMAFDASAAIFPGVSWPSSVVRSIIRTARSRAKSFASRLIERRARVAARSSTATWSTEPIRGILGSSGSSKPVGRAGAFAMEMSVARRFSQTILCSKRAAGTSPARTRTNGTPTAGSPSPPPGGDSRGENPTWLCRDVPKLCRSGRGSDPQPLEHPLVAAPPRAHLHLEIEKNRMAEQRLDLGTRPRPDRAHHRATFPGEDLLLRIGLDVEGGPHDLLIHLLDLDGDRVRHLVARQLQRLLPDELGDLLLYGEIRPLFGRKVQRPFRQEPDELIAELVHPVPRLRAYRMERVEIAETRRGVHLRRDGPRLQGINVF